MFYKHPSPAVGEGGGTQLEARRRGPPPWAPAGALWLIVLFLHAACATQGPAAGRRAGGGRAGEEAAESEARSAPRELQPVLVVYAAEVEARGSTRVVAVSREEYQRAVAQLLQHHQVHGTPQEAAQELLQAMPEEELCDAGEVFGKRIGTDAARALILRVATLTGRTLGEMATHLRSLPRFNQVQAQWAAQGMEGSVAVAMEEAAAVEVVEQSRALVVLTSPQAPGAINVLARSGTSGAGGHSGTVAIQHRGGNKQVILSSGERWHLPRGKSYRDIPAEDRLGDELQAAVKEVAAKWSHAELSPDERAAIDRMLKAGKDYRANLLERQA